MLQQNIQPTLQHTLRESFELEGKGLHTGLRLRARFSPAKAGFGVQICRIDLPDKPTYAASALYVSATERGTVLKQGDWGVSTIEHALSALYAMSVDNCLIEVDGPEMPILDGSAKIYVEQILRVGLVEQQAERTFLRLKESLTLRNEQTGSWLMLEPAEHFSVQVMVSFDSCVLGEQKAELADLSDYAAQVASARTFCFVREVEPLLKRGYIKGGDLKNAVVIYDEQLEQVEFDKLADSLGQSINRDARELGYLTELKFSNEPARHKLLDLIGDIALIGRPLLARLTAYKPGHTSNTMFAKHILEAHVS